MRLIAVISIVVLLSISALAQSPGSPSSTYIELLGNGLMYSFNYDHRFTESFGARVGIGYLPIEGHGTAAFPVLGYYLVGAGSSKLELGLGVSAFLQPSNASFSFKAATRERVWGNAILGTATVGYRYQRDDKGFVFRAGITPFFGKFTPDNPTPGGTPKEDVFRFRWYFGMSFGFGL